MWSFGFLKSAHGPRGQLRRRQWWAVRSHLVLGPIAVILAWRLAERVMADPRSVKAYCLLFGVLHGVVGGLVQQGSAFRP